MEKDGIMNLAIIIWGEKSMKKIKKYIRMFLNWIVKGYDR
jgi:hypothetical protein